MDGYHWPCDCLCPPHKQLSMPAQGQDNHNKDLYSESRRMGTTWQSLVQSNFEFGGKWLYCQLVPFAEALFNQSRELGTFYIDTLDEIKKILFLAC